VLKSLIHRLVLSAPVVFVATALSYVLVALVPGDSARAILGPLATPDQITALRDQLGLNRSVFGQYGDWLGGAVHGDLGTSLFTGETVTRSLSQHLSVTLSLLVLGTIVSTLLGVTLGVLGAVRGGLAGRVVDALALIGLAVPNFWLALLLIATFAVSLHGFPATGYVPFTDSPLEWARSLVLPVVSLSLGSSTIVAKQTRDAMRAVLEQDFVRTLVANGFPLRSIVLRHGLRNAGIPVVTVVGVVFVNLIGGTLLVEQVFAMPGLGTLAVAATTQHDLPMIQGVVLAFTLTVVAINLLVDLTYRILDPRVRT
jgi:peptide/nickel transport system permease protein